MRVKLTKVGHRFGDGPWLFRDLNLVLHPGHTYALTGPSGSGKSSLLSLIAGWSAPFTGTIERSTQGRISWVFQNPHGIPRRSALEHVMLPFLARGHSLVVARREAGVLLDRFALGSTADREFRALSGGEAQRLMLACGLAARPQLLLIDEPTAQLDMATGAEVNKAIAELVEPGSVVVVATHDEYTREACTDQIDLRLYHPSFSASPNSAPPTAGV
ncbi:putative ABC transport system ATP-binding protein/lipoprotein-releasing system ATP-binding protein [Leucobacter luti]|uniref:Putative ABC transport system ATP-binding protein/lipoprotein-releasing system ATP-binding protein n=1 Tax=Leucobacter luti TaxID=340320 RepID=A0A4R6RZ28_9MICO|nr:ATP-binding cassette domain-containing protein [Leucobacter luti]TDP92411.1 putative ABC transport system ATP-binding protein/lipoprotein-releasing system ATP-binding protein [Leucobacter luti]